MAGFKIRAFAYTSDVARYLETVETKIVPSVLASTLTGTARFLRRETIKRVSEKTGVPTAAIRPRIRSTKANAKKRRLLASVHVNQRHLPYHKIRHRQGPRGVNVSGLGRIERAWKDEQRNLIFQREGRKSYPITVPHVDIKTPADAELRKLRMGEGYRFFVREWNKRLSKRLKRGNMAGSKIAMATAKLKEPT